MSQIVCSICTLHNSYAAQNCDACGSPLSFSSSTSAGTSTGISIPSRHPNRTGAEVICTFCQAPNNSADIVCRLCQSVLPWAGGGYPNTADGSGAGGNSGLSTLVPGPAKWACLVCTLENSGLDDSCSMCSTPAPLWKCLGCTLANSVTAIKCSVCGEPRPAPSVEFDVDIPSVELYTERDYHIIYDQVSLT